MASERKLDELAADYVAGNFSAEEADEFAQLITDNPGLEAEVNRLEQTIGLLLDELPMESPPDHLRAKVLAGVEVEPRTVRSPGLSIAWVLAAIAAGTTVLSMVLGMNNHRLRLANQQLQQDLLAVAPAQQVQLILQQPTTRFYDFVGTDNAINAFGNMIVDTDGLVAALSFNNLEPLPGDRTYALWVLHEGEYVSCGEFQTTADGTAFATLPMPPVYQSRPWVRDVIVTVEPASLPAQPTGPIVAQTI